MGCGKSSVGRKLSELLCCSFVDLDNVIEEREGRSIPEIFATEGEATFRQMELDALRTIICHSDSQSDSKRHLVIALGGGTVMTPECAEIIHENTLCIYLRASVDTLVQNLSDEADGRPMLKTESSLRQRIEELRSLRAATYEKTAHIIVDTDGRSIDSIADDIIRSGSL